MYREINANVVFNFTYLATIPIGVLVTSLEIVFDRKRFQVVVENRKRIIWLACKMIVNLSILFVLILLSISTVFVTITFILPNWLQVKDESTAFNYGIWHSCTTNSLKCYRWYDNGQEATGYILSGEL